ncbi:hypothetical protein H5410_021324, partial [Solanum commersonii]
IKNSFFLRRISLVSYLPLAEGQVDGSSLQKAAGGSTVASKSMIIIYIGFVKRCIRLHLVQVTNAENGEESSKHTPLGFSF